MEPLAPLTVNPKFPAGVVADVFTVSATGPAEAGFGENKQLAPAGKLLHDRLTEPVNPAVPAMEIA